jgi:hypothetical protein
MKSKTLKNANLPLPSRERLPTALKNSMNAVRSAWRKLNTKPLSLQDNRKKRFFVKHFQELPKNVLNLLRNSDRPERNQLINNVVVKGSNGKWCFKLDVPYLQERLRSEFERCSAMSVWSCIHWHRWTLIFC